MAKEHRGTIVRMMPDGLGYLQDVVTHEVYTFNLGQVPGYRGESLRDVARKGIKVGAQVTFGTPDGSDDASVEYVKAG
jgi:hypothetical protein